MDVQTATVVITGISIIIGIIVFIVSRKQELETRQAQLFMQVYGQWTTPEFAKAYAITRYKTPQEEYDQLVNDVYSHNPQLNVELYTQWQTLQTYFEGLGLLVKKGLLDISFVEDLFSRRLIWWWEQHRTTYEENRKILNDPTLYDSLEYLYNLMKQRDQQSIAHT